MVEHPKGDLFRPVGTRANLRVCSQGVALGCLISPRWGLAMSGAFVVDRLPHIKLTGSTSTFTIFKSTPLSFNVNIAASNASRACRR
jgi:hypothetical protein